MSQSDLAGEEDFSDKPSLVLTLRVLAAWRKCSGCRKLALYVDERGRTHDDFLCTECEMRKQELRLLLSAQAGS
jgi:hypothetical protein